MISDSRVRIPHDKGKIVRRKTKGTTYIHYKTFEEYDPDKGYAVSKTTSIGKMCDDDPSMMIPNARYFDYYPDTELADIPRSSCLRAGTYMVLKKLFAETGIERVIRAVFGSSFKLFMDLCAYSMITENRTWQHYSYYAYDHPLFTGGMEPCSDKRVSSFIEGITKEERQEFLQLWLSSHSVKDGINILTDYQPGDMDLDGPGNPELNNFIGFDSSSGEPLFYESGLGSMVDSLELESVALRAKRYGYEKIRFIINHSKISEDCIPYMDENGYEFIIMMNSMQNFAMNLVLSNKEQLDNKALTIKEFGLSGMTVKGRLLETDRKDRFFHIYHDEDYQNKLPSEMKLCSYFVLITSQEMTAKEALISYTSCDESDRLYTGDRPYPSLMEFASLVIRHHFYRRLREHEKCSRPEKCMTVPKAIRELERIEMTRYPDGNYKLASALTQTQKEILKAFGLTEKDIREQAVEINRDLHQT